jgi:hypothetical protein
MLFVAKFKDEADTDDRKVKRGVIPNPKSQPTILILKLLIDLSKVGTQLRKLSWAVGPHKYGYEGLNGSKDWNERRTKSHGVTSVLSSVFFMMWS